MKTPDPIAQRGQAGLCASCLWARTVTSDKGSVFFLCGMSKHDSTFQKYPQLPVVECRAFRPVPENYAPLDEVWGEGFSGEIPEDRPGASGIVDEDPSGEDGP